MPWLKLSDQAVTVPAILELAEVDPDDPRLLNECVGWLIQCAVVAAAQLTDGVISRGVGRRFGGDRLDVLAGACVQVGLLEDVIDDKGRPAWRLIELDEFLHVKTREEVAWERQRRADRTNYELSIPVRVRDGDACRYCGRVVRWGTSGSALSATFDHREPGKAGTVATTVVSCLRCNSIRGNDADADERVPLLDAPSTPYYSPATRKFINSNVWAIKNGIQVPGRPGAPVQPGNVPPGHDRAEIDEESRRAVSEPTNPSEPGVNSEANRGLIPNCAGTNPQLGSGENGPLPADTGQSANVGDMEGARRDGTGRVGTGRDGSGRPSEGGPPSPPPTEARPRKSRRRRRGRGGRGQSNSHHTERATS